MILMVEKHNISFFGKDQALIVSTSNYKDNIHLNFIQKINDNWQKLPEGLQIAINIKETCEIAEFLENKEGSVNIIHKSPYNEDIKNFLFEFHENKDILFIKAKFDNKLDYKKFSKPIQKGELRAFTKLMLHMEDEKLERFNALERGSYNQ